LLLLSSVNKEIIMYKYRYSADLSKYKMENGVEETKTSNPTSSSGIVPRPTKEDALAQYKDNNQDPYGFMSSFVSAYSDVSGVQYAEASLGRSDTLSASDAYLSDLQKAISYTISSEGKDSLSMDTPQSSDWDVGAEDEAVAVSEVIKDAVQYMTASNDSIMSPPPSQDTEEQAAAVNTSDIGTGAEGSKTLLDFIAKGEGSYNSSNRGTKSGSIVGSSHKTQRGGKSLSEMTIGEIQELQSIEDPDNKNRLFAVGKYQLIPSTMSMAVKALGLPKDQVFDKQTQETLGMWLMMEKRPKLGAYIRGEHDDLDKAVVAAAKEWASLPDPETGNSFYGGGNKARHTVEETKRAIESARASYKKGN
jgi:hypothetical protein